MEPNDLLLPQAENSAGTHALLTRTWRIYRDGYRHWFAICAPTSVLASLVVIVCDWKIREFLQDMRPWDARWQLWLGLIGFRLSEFFLPWLLGCFAFGAIATGVSNLDHEQQDLWLRDSHQRSRERFGAIFLIALFTFGLLLAGVAGLFLVSSAAGRIFGLRRLIHWEYAITYIGGLVIVTIVSWFGMAIPLVLRGETTVRSAITKSFAAHEGYEGYLFLLLLESLGGSYVGWYAVHWILSIATPNTVRSSSWYGWLVVLVVALASAAVSPPFLIGLSVLANEYCQKADLVPDNARAK